MGEQEVTGRGGVREDLHHDVMVTSPTPTSPCRAGRRRRGGHSNAHPLFSLSLSLSLASARPRPGFACLLALPHCRASRDMADAAHASDDGDAAPARQGELLFCGSTSWETIGRKQANDGSTSLPAPSRLRALLQVPIVFIAAGSGARAPPFSLLVLFPFFLFSKICLFAVSLFFPLSFLERFGA